MKSSGVSYTRFNITQLRWWLGLENLLHLTNWSFACISWNNPGKRQFTGDFNPCFYSKNERPIHHLNVFGLETYANSQFKLHTHSCTVVHIKSLFRPNDISSTPSVGRTHIVVRLQTWNRRKDHGTENFGGFVCVLDGFPQRDFVLWVVM